MTLSLSATAPGASPLDAVSRSQPRGERRLGVQELFQKKKRISQEIDRSGRASQAGLNDTLKNPCRLTLRTQANERGSRPEEESRAGFWDLCVVDWSLSYLILSEKSQPHDRLLVSNRRWWLNGVGESVMWPSRRFR